MGWEPMQFHTAGPSEVVPTEVPISAALWARLKRFDKTCTISLSRAAPYFGPNWKHLPRVWDVRIHAHHAKAHEHIRVEHPVLEQALSEAVSKAEALKWTDTDLGVTKYPTEDQAYGMRFKKA